MNGGPDDDPLLAEFRRRQQGQDGGDDPLLAEFRQQQEAAHEPSLWERAKRTAHDVNAVMSAPIDPADFLAGVGHLAKGIVEPFVNVAARPTEGEAARYERGDVSAAGAGFAGKLGINAYNPTPEQRRQLVGQPQTRRELLVSGLQSAASLAAGPAEGALERTLVERGVGKGLARVAAAGAVGAPVGAAFDPEHPLRGAAVGAGLGVGLPAAVAGGRAVARGVDRAAGAVGRAAREAVDFSGIADGALEAGLEDYAEHAAPSLAHPYSDAELTSKFHPLSNRNRGLAALARQDAAAEAAAVQRGRTLGAPPAPAVQVPTGRFDALGRPEGVPLDVPPAPEPAPGPRDLARPLVLTPQDDAAARGAGSLQGARPGYRGAGKPPERLIVSGGVGGTDALVPPPRLVDRAGEEVIYSTGGENAAATDALEAAAARNPRDRATGAIPQPPVPERPLLTAGGGGKGARSSDPLLEEFAAQEAEAPGGRPLGYEPEGKTPDQQQTALDALEVVHTAGVQDGQAPFSQRQLALVQAERARLAAQRELRPELKTASGKFRDVAKVHEDGLLAEWEAQQRVVEREQPNTAYRIADADGYADDVEGAPGGMQTPIVVSTRGRFGGSRQSEAQRLIDQAQGVQRRIEAELQRRIVASGVPEAEAGGVLGDLLLDASGARAEQQVERAGMQHYADAAPEDVDTSFDFGGESGRTNARVLSRIAGAGAGGLAGGTQGDTPAEKARNAVLGAGAGYAGAAALERAPGVVRGLADDARVAAVRRFREEQAAAVWAKVQRGEALDEYERSVLNTLPPGRVVGQYWQTAQRVLTDLADETSALLAPAEVRVPDGTGRMVAVDRYGMVGDVAARRRAGAAYPGSREYYREQIEALQAGPQTPETRAHLQELEANERAAAPMYHGGRTFADNRTGAVSTRGVQHPAPPASVRPALDRVAQGIDFDGGLQKQADKNARGPWRHRLNQLADKLANGLGPLERLGQQAARAGVRPTQNPGELVSYVKAGEHTIGKFFNAGVVDPLTREVAGPSFKAVFEPLGDDDATIRQALAYVKAKRDAGRGLAGVGGDQAALDAARELVTWGDRQPHLADFAGRWESYVDGVGQYAVKSGLWTPELWAAMKQSDALYVPFKRILDSPLRAQAAGAAGGAASGGAQRLANVTPGVKRFAGSRKAVGNPAVALAEYTAAIVRRADRYRVGASLFDAAAALGPEGELLLTRVGGAPAGHRAGATAKALQAARQQGLDPAVVGALEDAFSPTLDAKNPVIWRNTAGGGREYATVHAADLFSAVAAMQDDGARLKLLDVTLRPLRRIFTATTTGLSPRFALATNPARDVVDALAKSEGGLTPATIARGYYEGVLDAFGKSATAEEAALAGLGGVSQFGREANPAAAARRFAPISAGQRVRSRAGRVVSAPLRALETLGEASDKGPRLGEYLAALEEARPKVARGEWTEADARLYAASRGRRVTIDFANKPGSKTLRLLDDYIPFFGVALKAPVGFAQAAARNPKRAAAVASAVAAASATAWALTQALPDEARAALRDRASTERAGYVLVPLDHTGENVLRVATGAELGLVHGAVTAALDKLAADDPHAGRLFAASITRALPPGVGEAVQGNFTIPIPGVQQLQENARNRRAFGGAPVEPYRLQGLPAAERRFDTTSPTYDLLAAGARAAGYEHTSPLQAENVVRGITSQATPFLTAATDPIAGALMGRDAQPRIPVPLSRHPLNPASAVLANPTPAQTESERDYYDLKQRATQAGALLGQAERTGAGADRVAHYRADLHRELRVGLEVTDELVNERRDREVQVRDAVQAGRLAPAEGRRQLDQLKQQRQAIYRRAMTMFREQGLTP